MLPSIVLVIGIMLFWNAIYQVLPLYNTIWIIVLAYVVLYLPYTVQYVTSAFTQINDSLLQAGRVFGGTPAYVFRRVTLPMISPTVFYLVITGFIGAFKAYSDAVALFGTNLNAAGMNTIVGYVYDMLYGDSGGYPSYASAAAIILFVIVLTITCINLLVSRKHVHYTK